MKLADLHWIAYGFVYFSWCLPMCPCICHKLPVNNIIHLQASIQRHFVNTKNSTSLYHQVKWSVQLIQQELVSINLLNLCVMQYHGSWCPAAGVTSASAHVILFILVMHFRYINDNYTCSLRVVIRHATPLSGAGYENHQIGVFPCISHCV